MESLSELQHPLLSKTPHRALSNQLLSDRCGYYDDAYSLHYHDRILRYLVSGGNDPDSVPESAAAEHFLDATSLHVAMEMLCAPHFLLCPDQKGRGLGLSAPIRAEREEQESAVEEYGPDDPEAPRHHGNDPAAPPRDLSSSLIHTVSCGVEDHAQTHYERVLCCWVVFT
ncbi:synapse differentiation-inducing gene protein 1-like [Engraulis encrasicolus]|uniref:synapse differentiation-inducing gene protein 1-like n=1 Tax=Engraulis encrasicolus TaxID=184585 RepID=UPI002FD07DC7